jgi:hypothetical protein
MEAVLTDIKQGKVLMQRESPPHLIEMVYWGPSEPLSVIVTDRDTLEQHWYTPLTNGNGEQSTALDVYNHPFSGQYEPELPLLNAIWQ